MSRTLDAVLYEQWKNAKLYDWQEKGFLQLMSNKRRVNSCGCATHWVIMEKRGLLNT